MKLKSGTYEVTNIKNKLSTGIFKTLKIGDRVRFEGDLNITMGNQRIAIKIINLRTGKSSTHSPSYTALWIKSLDLQEVNIPNMKLFNSADCTFCDLDTCPIKNTCMRWLGHYGENITENPRLSMLFHEDYNMCNAYVNGVF